MNIHLIVMIISIFFAISDFFEEDKFYHIMCGCFIIMAWFQLAFYLGWIRQA